MQRMQLSRRSVEFRHFIQSAHLPGKPGKVGKFKSGQRKCVLACGHLPRVLFLTQNMQERSSFLGKVLHIEDSCHSY